METLQKIERIEKLIAKIKDTDTQVLMNYWLERKKREIVFKEIEELEP